MRKLRHALILVACSTLSSVGCATTTTNVVGEQINNVERYIDTGMFSDTIQARRDGTHLNIRLTHERTNRPMRRVMGYENVVTAREVPAWVTVLAIGGAVAASVGVILAAPPKDSSGATTDSSLVGSQPVLGWSLIGAGGVAVLPWLFSSSGTSAEARAFARTEADGPPSTGGIVPAVNVNVDIIRRHSTVVSARTDLDGNVSFDLAESLPPDAIFGTNPWDSISVRSSSGAVTTVGLQDLPRQLAEGTWNEFRASPTPEAAALFLRRFPRDPRRAQIQQILSEARAAAQAARPVELAAPAEAVSANARDWIGLTNDPGQLEAFASRDPVDVYVTECRCRLGALAQDPATRRSSLEQCRRDLATMAPPRTPVEDAVYSRALQERDAAIASFQSAVIEQTPDLDAGRPRRHGARRDDNDRSGGLESRLRAAIDRCHDEAASVENARRAYTILAAMRSQVDAARYGALRTQINVTCRATPGAVGVTLP